MPTPTAASPFSFAMLSHTGRVRKGNEDTVAASAKDGAFVLCDGMGGAAAGEIASQLAADSFLAHLVPHPNALDVVSHDLEEGEGISYRRSTPDVRLDAAVHAANQAVFQRARRSPELRGMGTTLVALLLEYPDAGHTSRQPSLTLAHVGDSRCYLFREGVLSLLTDDHSLVEEQLRSGQITALEAKHHPMRNIITRAIGSQSTVEAEIRQLEPQAGDLFLLASDGLTRELSDAALAAVLERAHRASQRSPSRPLNLPGLCEILIDEANDAGGGDNISVLLLQLFD